MRGGCRQQKQNQSLKQGKNKALPRVVEPLPRMGVLLLLKGQKRVNSTVRAPPSPVWLTPSSGWAGPSCCPHLSLPGNGLRRPKRPAQISDRGRSGCCADASPAQCHEWPSNDRREALAAPEGANAPEKPRRGHRSPQSPYGALYCQRSARNCSLAAQVATFSGEKELAKHWQGIFYKT